RPAPPTRPPPGTAQSSCSQRTAPSAFPPPNIRRGGTHPGLFSLSSPWSCGHGRDRTEMRYRIGIGNSVARAGGDMMDSAGPAKANAAGGQKGTNVADHIWPAGVLPDD